MIQLLHLFENTAIINQDYFFTRGYMIMQRLTVIRFEGIYVICEDKEKKLFAIEKNEAPVGLKEGDLLLIHDDGTLCVDEDEANRRRTANVCKKERTSHK